MNRLLKEFRVFQDQPRSMRILLITNAVYALVLPVIEIFMAAYVMRNSHDESRVFTYQLSLYSAMPAAFFVNGVLLGRVAAKHLYAAGMVLSGVAMMMLMQTGVLTLAGIAAAGFAMGMATGTINCARGRVLGRRRVLGTSRRRGRRRRRAFPLVFPLQVSIPSTSVHTEYLDGDVSPVPARCGRKALKFFCRL